jgi:hypothetical protein
MDFPYAVLRRASRQAGAIIAIASLVAPAIAQMTSESKGVDAEWTALYGDFLKVQARLLSSPLPLKDGDASLEAKYDACASADETDRLLQLFKKALATLPPPRTEAGVRAKSYHGPDRIAVVQRQIDELRAKACDIDPAVLRQLAEMKAQDAEWDALLPRVYDVEAPLRKADPRFWDDEPSAEKRAEACTEVIEASRQLQLLRADFAALPAPTTKGGRESQRFLPPYFAGWQNEIDDIRAKVCVRMTN